MKNCPNCGVQIKEDAKFCRYCGKKLMQKQQPAPPAPQSRETPKVSETPPPAQAAPVWERPKASETPKVSETPSPAREAVILREPPPTWQFRQTRANADAVQLCPSCRSPLGKENKFCTVCGRAVPQESAPEATRQRRRHTKAWGIGIVVAVCVVGLGALAYFLLADGGALPWRGNETQNLEEQLEADETRKPSEETSGQTDAWQPELEEDGGGQAVAGFAQSAGQDNAEAGTEPNTPEEAPEPWSKAEEIDFDHLTELVEGQAPNATWAYCVLDLESGLGYGTLNATEALSASAMVIVPILYTLAARMADGQLGMDTQVPITQNLGGRTQLSQQVGSSLSVEELARYMLQYSDNIATNTLLEYLGFETVEAVCAANGYTSVSLANYVMATEDNTANDNYVSSADLCAMLFELYFNENSAIDGAFLEQYMHLQDDTEALGLLAQAPASLDTMNLNGQKTGKYNEVALVRDGESLYAMAFLGHGDKLEALQRAAKEVGQYCIETLELGE